MLLRGRANGSAPTIRIINAKNSWTWRRERTREEGRTDDRRANRERNLAGNESVAVWP